MLGVSLANRTYSSAFMRRVIGWLDNERVEHLDVVLFDALEEVNCRVFRGFNRAEARRISQHRGAELARMIERACGYAELRSTVILESLSAERASDTFRSARYELWQAWSTSGRLRTDIQHQVLVNLAERIQRHGRAFVEQRIDNLAEYVIEEIAFLVAYFESRGGTVEIYPGPSMFVKDRLFAGEYTDECPKTRLHAVPRFIDITWLANNPHGLPSRSMNSRVW